MWKSLVPAVLTLAALSPAWAGPLDPNVVNQIVEAAYRRGEVVETAAYLSDRIGPRLTNSPGMRQAERWTQSKYLEWGLKNVRAEGFEFGRGWSIEASRVEMVEPRHVALRAIPLPWTPSTNGALTAPIIVAPMKRERDFAKWAGKLKGKIVLASYPADPADPTRPLFERLSDEDLGKRDRYLPRNYDPAREDRIVGEMLFYTKLDRFLAAEGALAHVRMSRLDGRIVHGDAIDEGFKVGNSPLLPAVELAAEDYRRLVRLSKSSNVTVAIETKTHFDDSDRAAYNILAEIPGREGGEYVLAGAHLDSWVAGDGAADNGAGCAIVMEAARILSSLGVRPRRTIRFALWNGEEQGLHGSFAYVDRHLAKRAAPADPLKASLGPWWRQESYPITPLPGYKQLVAYFNIDNGGGRLRGIYTEGNVAAAPLLKTWLEPLAALGASSVIAGDSVGGTDHFPIARIGLPAFQFVQDPLEYGTRVHHTELDTFDHLRAEDLKQAAAVLAVTLLSAAESKERLPRNPVYIPPRPSNPFAVPNPDEE